jgi:hypothetical protein
MQLRADPLARPFRRVPQVLLTIVLDKMPLGGGLTRPFRRVSRKVKRIA